MNKEQILSAVASLAQSQGFYGRLLRELRGNEQALDYLEQHVRKTAQIAGVARLM